MSPSMRTKVAASRAMPLRWYAVWSLSVCALTSAPSSSASMLIRAASRVVVPLKAMCSTTWLMPFSRALSWPLPVRTNTLALALASQGMAMVTTRTPFDKVVRTVSAWGARSSSRSSPIVGDRRPRARCKGRADEPRARPYHHALPSTRPGSPDAPRRQDDAVRRCRPRRRRGADARRMPRTRYHLRDQLEGAGRARRLLPGARGRHVQEIRSRGRDPPGRPAGQQPAAAAGRPHRLPDDGQPAAQLRQREERRARRRRRLDVPEGSAGADRASERGLRVVRGSRQGARRLHREGRAVLVVAMAEGRLRLQGRQPAPVQLQRRALPREREEPAAGLRGRGADHDREGGPLQARRVPARRPWLQHLQHDDRGAHRHREEQAPISSGASSRPRRSSAGRTTCTATAAPPMHSS